MENIKIIINSLNLEYVQEKIEKFNRKAIKLGKRELKVNYSETYIDETDVEDIKELLEVEIEQFEDLVIADYKVIAQIDHTYPIVNFVKSHEKITDEQEKVWQKVDANCDHCKSHRARNITFILQQTETLEYIQVGKTCLKDFLGHDISKTLNYFNLLQELEFDINDYDSQSSGETFYKIMEILGMVQNEIKENGYNSSKQKWEHGTPTTGERVREYMSKIYNDKSNYNGNLPTPSQEQQESIQSVVDYMLTYNTDGEKLQDFYNNLKNILRYDYCKYKDIGILSTLFIVVDIIKANELEESQKQVSEYFGKIGDKIEVTLTLEGCFGYDTEYGYMHINLFKDVEGNIFKWCSKNTLELEKGEFKRIKATIKAHEEYNDIKQTTILRCKII